MKWKPSYTLILFLIAFTLDIWLVANSANIEQVFWALKLVFDGAISILVIASIIAKHGEST